MSEQNTQFILASASPRRTEILSTLGLTFEVRPSAIDERPIGGETPQQHVMRVAEAKVDEIAKQYSRGIVIGADTAVVIDGHALGKPVDVDDAKRMLRLLSGRWHAVLTGLAVHDIESSRRAVEFEKTLVRFRDLSDDEIETYIGTGEPADKAGAYGIQGRGMLFVTEIAGNYQNVVGLPAPLLERLMVQIGSHL